MLYDGDIQRVVGRVVVAQLEGASNESRWDNLWIGQAAAALNACSARDAVIRP